MSEQRTGVLRGMLRVLTGLGLTIAGAVLFLNLGVTEIEPITRDVPSAVVDTSQSTQHVAVCPGAFQQLGSDPSNPDVSAALGSVRPVINGDLADATPIETGLSFTTEGERAASGAQSQRLDDKTVSGLAAYACASPSNESWIAAGSTERGLSGTVVLTNPGSVPATVRLTMHDETGTLAESSGTGVLVPAQSQRTVSLNGFGAGKVSPVIEVHSTGAPIVASLAMSEMRDIVPTGADLINSQDAPNDTLVFPGVVNYVDHSHHDDHGDAPDEFPAYVRLLLPKSGGASGYANASVQAVMPDGSRQALAESLLAAGTVVDVQIDRLPEQAAAIIVEAEAPVVGGLFTSVHNNNDHDFTWMTPSPVFEAGETVDTVVLPGGILTAVNLGSGEATIRVHDGDASEIEAGGGARLSVPEVSRITSSEPFALGVTLTNNRELSAYPVLGAPLSLGELTVYTR